MREALKKSETITDKMVSISGSVDHRLSTLEIAMRPTQIRTHAIRKAHENIDKTLKAAEVILSQFDLSIQVEDPLMQATKYLKLLQKHLSESTETHLLSFDVNMRKQKTLLALQAVKHLLWLDAEHPDLHRCLIKFFSNVGSMPAPVTDAEKLIWGVFKAERPTISCMVNLSLMQTPFSLRNTEQIH